MLLSSFAATTDEEVKNLQSLSKLGGSDETLAIWKYSNSLLLKSLKTQQLNRLH